MRRAYTREESFMQKKYSKLRQIPARMKMMASQHAKLSHKNTNSDSALIAVFLFAAGAGADEGLTAGGDFALFAVFLFAAGADEGLVHAAARRAFNTTSSKVKCIL